MKKCNLGFLFLLSLEAGSSVLDSAYRAKASSSSSVTKSIYSSVLKAGYSTDCKMLPSDSAYVASAAKKCGFTNGLLRGIGRFMNEPDAGTLGFNSVTSFTKVSYENQVDDCSFFD